MRRRSKPHETRAHAALAVSLVAVLASGCASLLGRESIEVNVAGITPLASTAFEHRLRVDLRLRNPNDRTYQIEGLRFVLDVNGSRLASGMSSETATLPRLGEVVIPVTTTTSTLDLVNQIVAFGRQPQPQFDYALRGKVFLKGMWGNLSFEHRGTQQDLFRSAGRAAPQAPGIEAR